MPHAHPVSGAAASIPSPSTARTPLIVLKDASVTLDGKRLLHDISFSIAPGEIVTLVGPNGGGKSTLLRLVIGDLRSNSGRVDRSPELRIGFMPQKLAIDPTFPITARRFLALGGGATGSAPTASEIDAALERVNAARFADTRMTGLSGGELQRVLLARAILNRPTLFVLDEPTQGLDQAAMGRFYRLLAELRRETGAAVLMASHDLHVVMAASNRVLCVNGHVCCEGAPEHVSAHPAYRELFAAPEAEALGLYTHHHDHRH